MTVYFGSCHKYEIFVSKFSIPVPLFMIIMLDDKQWKACEINVYVLHESNLAVEVQNFNQQSLIACVDFMAEHGHTVTDYSKFQYKWAVFMLLFRYCNKVLVYS